MPLDEQPEHYSANLRTDRRPFVAPSLGFEPRLTLFRSRINSPLHCRYAIRDRLDCPALLNCITHFSGKGYLRRTIEGEQSLKLHVVQIGTLGNIKQDVT